MRQMESGGPYCFNAAVFIPNVTVAWNTTALPENSL